MDRLRLLALFILINVFLITFLEGHLENTTYFFSNDPIDIVIPCCSKDAPRLDLCIRHAKKHVANIRRVIVVSSERLTNEAEWFDESRYPFTKKEVSNLIFHQDNHGRVGWYYQQLLKLYVHYVIPNLSSNVLLLDSDTFFLRDVEFLNEYHAGLYAVGKEYFPPYFEHMDRLIPGLGRVNPEESGIVHHMLIQASIIFDLINTIEITHKMEAWKAFCLCVAPEHSQLSGASEYEIYFNYAMTKSNQLEKRRLKWKNISHISNLKRYAQQKYDFVSCHCYEY